MSAALDLLRERLAATPLAPRGLRFEEGDDGAVALAHDGAPTGVRAALRLLRVPALAGLRVEGRWLEVTARPSLLAADPSSAPVVLLVVDAAGHTAWATRDELLARLAPAQRPDGAETWQLRLSALSGAAGFGLHRMILTLSTEALRPALEGPGAALPPGATRARALLRRFVEEGDGFDAEPDALRALGVPGWFVAAHATATDAAAVTLATPPYFERVTIELDGACESLAVRGCALRCARGGSARATWVNDQPPGPVALTLRYDHARNTLDLRAALRGEPTSASALSPGARFVWRFGQGGRLALAPACAAAGVTVASAFAAAERETLPHGVVETLDALAAVERATGRAFEVTAAALGDPAQAAAIGELLRVRSSGRIERAATAMRLTLTAAEVTRLLASAGHQRRMTFQLPPSQVSQAALGVAVPLGLRTQEVTGTLARSPAALAAAVAAMGPAESIEVELSEVELRETYEPAPRAATTTAAPATGGAPSGSRSGST